MRNVSYAINLTLDGCCDHTKFKLPADDEVLEHYTHLLRDFDLLVYGRKTYQLMVPYWPDIAKSQSERRMRRASSASCSDQASSLKTTRKAMRWLMQEAVVNRGTCERKQHIQPRVWDSRRCWSRRFTSGCPALRYVRNFRTVPR
jgi:hypothetical protein